MGQVTSRRQTIIPEVRDYTRLFHADPVAGKNLVAILKALRNVALGLPMLHARTHLGLIGAPQVGLFGGDGIFSPLDPLPVVFGGTASPGHPAGGAAAWDHEHAFDPGPLQDLLDAIQGGVLNVSDKRTQELLEDILEALGELQDAIRDIQGKSLMLSAQPPRTVDQNTIVQAFAGTNGSRRLLRINNDTTVGILFVGYDPSVTITDGWIYKLFPGGELVLDPAPPLALYGIWDAANPGTGVARIAETSRV